MTRGEWTLVWSELTQGLRRALEAAGIESGDRLDRVELAIPRDRTHGDWTTNVAMILAKVAKQPHQGAGVPMPFARR